MVVSNEGEHTVCAYHQNRKGQITMNRCTVCGAASREGAKFCTSCGTPLVDQWVDQPAAPDSLAAERAADSNETSASTYFDEGEPTSAPSPTSGRDDIDTSNDRDADSATAARDDSDYVSSWPGAGSADEDDRAAIGTDQGDVSDTTLRENTAWPGASNAADDDRDDDVQVFTAARERSAIDNDVDSEPDHAIASEDIDHHGASDWESWAPTASGPTTAPATASSAFDEHLDSVHTLVDELQHRLDRLGRPASLASRDLNPDDLADQLEGWSRALPNSDELFEIVQQVRRSPRDVDAMIQLADHAADLELLVRHYQSITSASDQWAAGLRRTREDSTDS